MEYIVAVIILAAIGFLIFLIKKSITHAKESNLLEDEVIVTKEFYDNACEMVELMTNAKSREEQNQKLPKTLNSLEKEINKSNNRNFNRDLAESV